MVYRIFVEKKQELASEAKSLLADAKNLLGIEKLENVRVLNRYDAENITRELFDYYARLGYQRCTRIQEFVCAGAADEVQLRRINAEEFARQRKGSLHPVCIVDYDRFAFTYPVEDVRITLDMDVRTRPYSTELFNRYLPTVPVMDEGECVLEVKYNGFLPSHILWMLEGVPKQRMAVSKYVKCMSVLE